MNNTNPLLFNLHTHSDFCDGKSAPSDYVEHAIALGFHTLGFSSHAPVPFANRFSLSFERLTEYRNAIALLAEKYKDQLSVFSGLEIDYIPGMTLPFSVLKEIAGIGYTIGGVHLIKAGNDPEQLWFIDGPLQEKYDEGLRDLFGNDIRKAVTAYYHQLNEMITTCKPDIIAHIDKIKMHNKGRYFAQNDGWYVRLVDETLDLIRAGKNIVEVNTRGIYKNRCDQLYPGESILRKILSMKIPVTISTDAHHPSELDAFLDETQSILVEIGFRELKCLGEKGWYSIPLRK